MASAIEKAKKKAAFQAVDTYVRSGQVLGIGSGSTIVYAVERLRDLSKEEKFNVVCVPTSFQAHQLIVKNGLTLGDLSRFPAIDIAIDGADEVDHEGNLIKGGGGCQLQEKLVASFSKTLVIVGDFTKRSKFLCDKWKKGVPVEVVPMAYVPLMRKMQAMGFDPVLRMAAKKCGPVVTDNGNFIVDMKVSSVLDGKKTPSPADLHSTLIHMPGVVETGIFTADLVHSAIFGLKNGKTEEVVFK